MKKSTLLVLTIIMFFSCTKQENDNGNNTSNSTDKAVFSISENQKVCFAPSNLTFTDANYSFALYQYNYGSYFGWGTGNNPGLVLNDDNYYQNFYDWGYYIEGGYRTLTLNEWEYILSHRDHCLQKRATGSVNGTHGLIILPDNWTLPEGCVFNSGFGLDDDDWSTNSYNIAQWQKMESSGAVFLSAAGVRINTTLYQVGEIGTYWTPTIDTSIGSNSAYFLRFTGCAYGGGIGYGVNNLPPFYYNCCGRSVRLVKDVVD